MVLDNSMLCVLRLGRLNFSFGMSFCLFNHSKPEISQNDIKKLVTSLSVLRLMLVYSNELMQVAREVLHSVMV
jgi:hypothetical protein